MQIKRLMPCTNPFKRLIDSVKGGAAGGYYHKLDAIQDRYDIRREIIEG